MAVIIPVHFHGTMAADGTFRWKVPETYYLQHASLVASNAANTTVKIGTLTDDDKILTSTAVGQSGTAVEKTVSDWASTNTEGRIDKGDTLLVTVDYDGAAGTAGANVSVVLTFGEG